MKYRDCPANDEQKADILLFSCDLKDSVEQNDSSA